MKALLKDQSTAPQHRDYRSLNLCDGKHHHDDDDDDDNDDDDDDDEDEEEGAEGAAVSKSSSLLSKPQPQPQPQPETISPLRRSLLPPRIFVDLGAYHFAMRMAILLGIGSLFVLVGPPDHTFPQGLWVMITLLFISWFPRLDAASVVEKSMQRLLGTLIGAALGLGCGFASMLMPSNVTQSIFIGVANFVVSFGVVYVCGSVKIAGRDKILSKFNYATILCLLTFQIAVMPFYSGSDPKWRRGAWRVVNVIIGCAIGSVGSVLLWSRSTTSILRDKVTKQIRLAGESSQAALHAAADAFSGHLNPLGLADELLETPSHRRTRLRMTTLRRSHRDVDRNVVKEEGDIVLAKYVDAIQDWKDSKAIFPVVPYDPFHWFHMFNARRRRRRRLRRRDNVGGTGARGEENKNDNDNDNNVENEEEEVEAQRDRFYLKTARILAQALRIQTMIVCLDGIIRNDMPGHDFDDEHIGLFAGVGTSIRTMLTVPLNEETGDKAAWMTAKKLSEVRRYIREMSGNVSKGKKGGLEDGENGGGETFSGSNNEEHSHRLYAPVFESIFQRMGESYDDNDNGNGINDDNDDNDDDDNDDAANQHAMHCASSSVLLFLQLVEQLILRSLRLYHTWRKAAKELYPPERA